MTKFIVTVIDDRVPDALAAFTTREEATKCLNDYVSKSNPEDYWIRFTIDEESDKDFSEKYNEDFFSIYNSYEEWLFNRYL